MQGAADRAAVAAGIASYRGRGEPVVEARAVAARHGFVHGRDGVQVLVGPPRSGAWTGNGSAFEVTVRGPVRLSFTRLFLKEQRFASGRAVAAPTGGTCVLVLGSGNRTLDVGGSGALDLPGCDLFNNSEHAAGTQVAGAGGVQAKNVSLSGDYTTTGGGFITASEKLRTSAPPVRDPYADRALPAYSGCDRTGLTAKVSTAFAAGPDAPFVFCGGLKTSGSGTLSFGPGVYVFESGGLDLTGGQWTVAGEGVTLVFTGAAGSAVKTLHGTGSVIDLKAPGTGPTAGIAIWVDGRVSAEDLKLTGNSSLAGTVYAPRAGLELGGHSGSPCTQLVVGRLSMTGSARLDHRCAGTGVSDVGGSFKLVQ